MKCKRRARRQQQDGHIMSRLNLSADSQRKQELHLVGDGVLLSVQGLHRTDLRSCFKATKKYRPVPPLPRAEVGKGPQHQTSNWKPT